MGQPQLSISASAASSAATGWSASTCAATTVQIGSSGKTFASSAGQCAINPSTGVNSPKVQAGSFNPTARVEADVVLNGVKVNHVLAAAPVAD
ncbi:hypothetical protein OY671_010712, partial [Metschnikowia pulcherrima]